jgi:thioredoxin 2
MTLDHNGVLLRCPSCGNTNRLKYSALERASKCGKCKTLLPLADIPIDVRTSAEFDAATTNASVPAWCGPCKMVAPEMAKVAKNVSGRALVLKVDTDANPDLSSRFGIRSIPTIAVFHHGREVTRASGVRPASAIEAMVPQLV